MKSLTKKQIQEELAKDRTDFSEANLRGADLRWADLYGANLYGAKYRSKTITKPIKQMYLEPYWITLIENYLRIGCKEYTVKQWLRLSKKKISSFDTKALEFYEKHKNSILEFINE